VCAPIFEDLWVKTIELQIRQILGLVSRCILRTMHGGMIVISRTVLLKSKISCAADESPGSSRLASIDGTEVRLSVWLAAIVAMMRPLLWRQSTRNDFITSFDGSTCVKNASSPDKTRQLRPPKCRGRPNILDVLASPFRGAFVFSSDLKEEMEQGSLTHSE